MADMSPAAPADLLGARRAPARRGDPRRRAAQRRARTDGSPFAEFRDEAERVAAGLHDLECIGPGTVVSWQLPTAHRHARAARRADPARRGAEPDHPDHARARGPLHHQRGADRVLHRAAASGAASTTSALGRRDRGRDRVHRVLADRHAAHRRPVGAAAAARSRAGAGAGCTTRPVRRPTPRARGTPTRR